MCNFHEIVVLEVEISLCVHSYMEFQELSTIPNFPFYFRPSQIVTCSSASGKHAQIFAADFIIVITVRGNNLSEAGKHKQGTMKIVVHNNQQAKLTYFIHS